MQEREPDKPGRKPEEDVVQRLAELGDVLRKLESVLAAASVSAAKVAEFTARVDREMPEKLTRLLGQVMVPAEMPGNNRPSDEGPLGSFKRIAESSIVLGALLYAAGFGYLYRYHRSFGLSFSDLNIPIQETLVFAFSVAFHNLKELSLFLIFTLVPALALTQKPIRKLVATPLGTCALLLVLFGCAYGLFLSGSRVGYEEALTDITEGRSSKPLAAVSLNPKESSSKASPTADDRCHSFYDCRLLLHASGRYYMFRTVSATDTHQGAFRVPVFIIPEHEVRAIRIQSGPWEARGR